MDLLHPANTPRPAQINAALLILRITSALAFLYHGSAILFGAFGGPGPQKFSALMHLPHGFDVGKGGAEYALMQLLIAIALLITGAGAYSLAPRLSKPLRKL